MLNCCQQLSQPILQIVFCFFHFLETQPCCLCPNGRYNLPLAAQPPDHPSHPTPPFQSDLPLIYATHDITVAVKKVAQNPAVLAN